MSTAAVAPMLIDLENEEVITLAVACHCVPGRTKPAHINTLHRWRLRGFRDGAVKLECVRIGIEWHTSKEALLRFIQALNPVTIAKESPQQRTRRSEAAHQELVAAGFVKQQPEDGTAA